MGSQIIILWGTAMTACQTVHNFVSPSKINKYLFFRMLVLNIFHGLCDTNMGFLLCSLGKKRKEKKTNVPGTLGVVSGLWVFEYF